MGPLAAPRRTPNINSVYTMSSMAANMGPFAVGGVAESGDKGALEHGVAYLRCSTSIFGRSCAVPTVGCSSLSAAVMRMDGLETCGGGCGGGTRVMTA